MDKYIANPEPTRLKDKKLKYVIVDDGARTVSIPAKRDVNYSNIDNDFEKFVIDISEDIGANDYGFDLVITSGREGKHAKGSKH